MQISKSWPLTRLSKYFKIWYIMTVHSIEVHLVNRLSSSLFIFGKLLRFGMFLAFMYFLFFGVKQLAGFNRWETLLFLISFFLISSAGQMFFREIYRFRGRVVSGDFDFDLVKPIHPLFRNLLGGFDPLDIVTLPFFIIALVKVLEQIHFGVVGVLLYIVLVLNGILIMTALHIFVAGFGVMTTEVDHAMLIYRDLETMGRYPIEIYKHPLRGILTYLIPIAVTFTLPVEALLGLLSWQPIIIAFTLGVLSFWFSLKFWDFSLKHYSSASS